MRSQLSWKAFHVRCPQAALGPVSATTAASRTSLPCAVAKRGATVVAAAAIADDVRNSRRGVRALGGGGAGGGGRGGAFVPPRGTASRGPARAARRDGGRARSPTPASGR